jgi:hypothetical protein
MSRADWAVYDYVRARIEAKCRLARVQEERVQLKLHACRMAHWLMRQTSVAHERTRVELGVDSSPLVRFSRSTREPELGQHELGLKLESAL